MKTLLISSLVLLSASPTFAGTCVEKAKTFNGDAAAEFAYVLKNSAFAKKTAVRGGIVLSAKEITCVETSRGVYADALPTYRCTAPASAGPLLSKFYYEVLNDLGIQGDAATSHYYLSAKDITCNVAISDDESHDRPNCTVTAVWASDCQEE